MVSKNVINTMILCIFVQSKNVNRGKSTIRLQSKIDDTMFWKKVAREYISNEEATLEKEAMQAKQGDM